MPLGTEEIPLQATPHFGMLFFVLLIWHLLLYSVLWYPLVPVLIEDANQVPARQEYIWQCICSLKVLTLLFPLPLILGNRKRRGRKLYSKLFMNQEAAVGCRWFWFWTYFWRKVKGNVYWGFKNLACSLMAGFLWEDNSKLLFSFASFSLRGS